ncbi:PREDICTED: fatty acid 2-hydroxylase [Papilio xuthus]|uniref:Fatty acid 2-hydroxylase n=1 Tax=Papilio xuthus TaxID=66420 RepID=A0AAJ6Z7R5_PAPXU|nr:PREDICTED: fatty acid 2-hydroxylase [Papilio xuthus]
MGSDDFPVAFDGRRYDLRRFLKDHPGGVNTLERYKGKSITQAMKIFGHSNSAYHMLGDFKVGEENGVLTGDISGNGRIITKEEENRDEKEIAHLEELESRLDWSMPIFCQLGAIASDYDKWVHSAVFRNCRLFANPIMESMTYTQWYLVPTFWVPIIIYLMVTVYYQYVNCGDSCGPDSLTSLQYIQQLISGVLLWTILEYSLHRWVFHFNPGSNLNLIRVHFLIHGIHHKVPFDGLRQVFPPIPAALLAALLYFMLYPLVSYPIIKLIGGLIGYLIYDMIHYYVHHGSPKDGTYLYAMKRYHSNHHFVNHDKAFGISSKIWDHVFKTFVQVKKLSFSLRW